MPWTTAYSNITDENAHPLPMKIWQNEDGSFEYRRMSEFDASNAGLFAQMASALAQLVDRSGIAVQVLAANVTHAAGVLTAADPDRLIALLYNHGSATVYLDTTSDVTDSTGFPLAAGDAFKDDLSGSAWYGVTASGQTSDVRLIIVRRATEGA